MLATSPVAAWLLATNRPYCYGIETIVDADDNDYYLLVKHDEEGRFWIMVLATGAAYAGLRDTLQLLDTTKSTFDQWLEQAI